MRRQRAVDAVADGDARDYRMQRSSSPARLVAPRRGSRCRCTCTSSSSFRVSLAPGVPRAIAVAPHLRSPHRARRDRRRASPTALDAALAARYGIRAQTRLAARADTRSQRSASTPGAAYWLAADPVTLEAGATTSDSRASSRDLGARDADDARRDAQCAFRRRRHRFRRAAARRLVRPRRAPGRRCRHARSPPSRAARCATAAARARCRQRGDAGKPKSRCCCTSIRSTSSARRAGSRAQQPLVLGRRNAAAATGARADVRTFADDRHRRRARRARRRTRARPCPHHSTRRSPRPRRAATIVVALAAPHRPRRESSERGRAPALECARARPTRRRSRSSRRRRRRPRLDARRPGAVAADRSARSRRDDLARALARRPGAHVMDIVRRAVPAAADALAAAGVHPVLARVFAARGVTTADELDTDLARLPSFATMKGIDAAATRLADAIAAPRAHRDRRRLRCRRRHRVRGRRARTRRDGRRRRLPRPQSLRIRLRPHAGDRRAGGGARTATHRHRRQRHREPRRRRRGGRARHRGADHRSSPARGDASRARADRQSQSAGLRVSGQASRRRRRDVLRAHGDPRASCANAASSRGGAEPNLAQLLDLVALGTVADVVRLDRDQPHAGRAGARAHSRRTRAARDCRAVLGRRPRSARAPARTTWASSPGRASTRRAASPT